MLHRVCLCSPHQFVTGSRYLQKLTYNNNKKKVHNTFFPENKGIFFFLSRQNESGKRQAVA